MSEYNQSGSKRSYPKETRKASKKGKTTVVETDVPGMRPGLNGSLAQSYSNNYGPDGGASPFMPAWPLD